MRNVLSALVTLLLGATASATIYDTNYYPTNTGIDTNALRVCESMSNWNKQECLQAILGKGFSTSALNVCSSISAYSESEKIACLNGIANKAFQGDATRVCQGISDFNKRDCLNAIANLRFAPEAVEVCKAGNVYMESNKIDCLKSIAEKTYSKTALNFCSTITDYNRNDCMKSIAGNYYQDSAVEVCSRVSQYMESDKLACLSLIKNKIYDGRLLNFCASAGYQINDCMRGLQSTATSLPGFTTVQRQRTDLEIVLDAIDYVINGPQTQVIVVQQQKPPVVVNRPPVVVVQQANKCLVKATGESVNTEDFYARASTTARSNNKCVVARMANTNGSSRLIDATGRVRIQNATYKQIDDYKRGSDLKGKGCMEFICDDAAR